jgi:hypothetical protein
MRLLHTVLVWTGPVLKVWSFHRGEDVIRSPGSAVALLSQGSEARAACHRHIACSAQALKWLLQPHCQA